MCNDKPRPRVFKETSKEPPRVLDNTVSPLAPIIKTPEPTCMQQYIPNHIHRYLTKVIIEKAATAAQIEQTQLKSLEPATHEFLTEIVNQPNLLKCKEVIKSPDKLFCERGMCNELGRLAQGCKSIKGRNTIFFINEAKTPKGKHIAHARIVCAHRPCKTETHRVRLTVGWNLISHAGVTSTSTAAITSIKANWNFVISAPNIYYATLDVNDFYLNSRLKDYEQ